MTGAFRAPVNARSKAQISPPGHSAGAIFPERRRTAPGAVGLPKAEGVVLNTADGERVIVWHVPPREGQPIFLYFHGNGGSLRWRDERFRAPIADGSGLVALSYRGYGGSSGRPTETDLIEDAAAA